jgi:TonB-linked SusC/RagA family outer membrane protein
MISVQRGILALALITSPVALRAAPTLHIRSVTSVAPAFVGAVRGRVVDRESGQPVLAAQVVVLGTRLGAVTDNSGNFVIRGVPNGTASLRVARIGYQASTVTVSISEGGEATANVSLARAVMRLEQVITTATGSESRREFGNVVAVVKADSIAAKAPVQTVNDLLQGRAAGVQVIQGTGQVGSSSSIRIRGASSLSLTNEPLIVIDGIRMDNAPEQANFSTTRINKLSSMNPDEIADVQVIKGPSAAALYGTAAANGVVIVTTKRGAAGAPKWNVRAEYGTLHDPADKYDRNYLSWGQGINAAGTRVGPPNVQCTSYNAAAKTCVVDSLTTYNPWTAPETAPFTNTPHSVVGLQVSGGSDLLKYFLSAERTDETGPYTMPQSERARILAERGTGPRDLEIHPNQLKQNSFRGNFSVALAPTLNLDINSGYSRRDLWNTFEGTFFAGMTFQYLTGPGFKNATNGSQREFVGDIFGVENSLRQDRLLGSATLNWQPRTWLTGRAVVGIDQTNAYGYRLQLNGQGPRVGVSWGPNGREGGIDNERNNSSRYSTDVNVTATYNVRPDLTTRTTLGGQAFFDALYRTQGEGYGLPPGASTPNSARLRQAWEFTTEEKTYGAFIEEQLGWRDRVFFTLGGRTDQTSAFGRNAGNTFYPRAAVSYVISDESWFPKVRSLSHLRLRSAFGKAGVQPSTIAALQYLGAASFPAGAVSDEPGLRLASLGNANLKPEVTTELEGGADIGLFGDRVNIEATLYRKLSHDALYEAPLAPSLGTSAGPNSPTQWKNLAAVENRGVELTVDAQLVQSAALTWDLRVNGSHVSNRLVDAGTVALPTAPGERNEVGYPLFGLWDRPILGFADADGNGVISDAEITVGPAIAFRGSTLPEYEAGLSNTFGFLNNRLQLTTLFDYRGHFYKRWRYEEWRCQTTKNCRSANDPSASLEDQAAAAAANSAGKRTIWGYFVPNDFIKFRELSLSYSVPEALVARYARGRSLSLIVSGRNLGYLWNKYPGVDPETNNSVGNAGGGNTELTAQPPIRYFIFRVNLGL